MPKKANVSRIVKGIGFTPDIWEQVRAYAVVENRNMSNMVCTILERYFNEQKAKNIVSR